MRLSRIDLRTRKKPAFLYAILSIALAANLFAACQGPYRLPSKFAYFRVMWNDDASTTATIGWSSMEKPSSKVKLYYDTVDHGTEFANYAFSKSVDSKNLAFDVNHAFFRLKGLKPQTRYYFVVSDGRETSARYYFETAPNDRDSRLSIIAGGDSRNNREPRQAANLLVAKLKPHGVLFGGDMTDNGTALEWKEWFEDWQLTYADDGRITPVMVARGNHEWNDAILVNLFDTPKGVYYGVNLGGDLLRAYTLNSESSVGGKQTDWLKMDLTANSHVTWKVAQYHRPMRPHIQSKKEGTKQYTYWASLFYEHGMNVVVESDAHTVKSTWPIRPSDEPGSNEGFIRDDAHGTVYVGEGCWGAPLRDPNDQKPWTRDSGKFNHFNWILVDQEKMEIRTVKVANADEVESLTEDTRFAIPANLDIWTPENGSIITIRK